MLVSGVVFDGGVPASHARSLSVLSRNPVVAHVARSCVVASERSMA